MALGVAADEIMNYWVAIKFSKGLLQ